MPTVVSDVIALLDRFDESGAGPVVLGGWGVDALAGRSTRVHRDLDVLVRADHLDEVVARCVELGYRRGVEWFPVRVELRDPTADRHVDLHPAHPDGEGGWWQHGLDGTRFDYPAASLTIGSIGGRPVCCPTRDRQLELHSGHEHRPEDRHDVAVRRSLVT